MISHIQNHRRLRIQGSYQPQPTNISCQEPTPRDLFHRAADNEQFPERLFIMRNQQQGGDIHNSSSIRRRRTTTGRSSPSVSGSTALPSATVVTPRSCRSECEKDLLEMIDEILHQGLTSK